MSGTTNKILSNLDDKNLAVKTILANVSLSEKNNNYSMKAFNAQHEELALEKKIGTASTLEVIDTSNNVTIDKITVVLYGDTTGDGVIASADALAIIKNRTNKVKFANQYYTEAGRITSATRKNKAVPSSADALTIIKYKLNKENIEQYYEQTSSDNGIPTVSQKNALEKANEYLKYMPFSKEGLISQLEFEKFSYEDALYAVEHCGADWDQQALKSAKQYLEYGAFSYKGLIEQLEFEKYTTSEATYAANNCKADWNQQALKSAKEYLEYGAFSYKGLIEQLEFENYTTSEATYATNNCQADWNEQAEKCAREYLKYSAFSRERLIEQLEFEGFTHEQAVYGVEKVGL